MKTKLFLLGVLLSCVKLLANNIQVNNVQLENHNDVTGEVDVKFDISWENSWRISQGPSNWDAAWVFVKYRVNSGNWSHATLTDFGTIPAGVATSLGDDSGAFIYRADDGSGNFSATDIVLRWNYPSGITTDDVLDVQVQAIEMVYVPEGSFYIGGPGLNNQNANIETNRLKLRHYNSYSFSEPYQVTSEAANSSFDVNTDTSGGSGLNNITIESDFPKGFAGFYCMKYELTEGQWLSFFNCLTPEQKTSLDITNSNHKNSDNTVEGNTISWLGDSTSASSSAPERALNHVSSLLFGAYLDWAGLRPMTELEFEKSCRGPIEPKLGEYAWGNAHIAKNTYSLSSTGSSSERITNMLPKVGNANYDATDIKQRAYRSGIFAAGAIHKSREETGGSYYGIMELSGNVYERCITVESSEGRNFRGTHGDGEISENVSGYLPENTYGFRGGSYDTSDVYLRVADRAIGVAWSNISFTAAGIRGVRTAP